MLSFSTLGCPLWSMEEILATAKDLKYDGVEVRGVGREINAAKVAELNAESAALKKRLADLNLTIPILSSGAVIGVAEQSEKGMEEAKAYIDTAAGIDVPMVRVLCERTPDQTGHVDLSLLKDNYLKLLSYSANKNVSVLLETNGVFCDTAKLSGFMSGIEAKNAGVVYDIHHPFRYGGELPVETVENIAPYVRHVHMKDSCREHGQLKYRLCGYGSVPLADAVKLLQDRGYNGFYSLEWVKRWDKELVEAGIAFPQYKSYMDNLFKII